MRNSPATGIDNITHNIIPLFLYICRPNVCKVREEDVEEQDDQNKEASTDVEVKVDPNEQLFQAFQLNLETCVEKANKYQCKKM